MEYAEGGELFDYIVQKKRLLETEVNYFFFQIINALDYLHSNKVAHRDLKPENLLLSDEKNKILKLIDFGLSNDIIDQLTTPCGSPSYAAPEMILGKKYSGVSIDIWSTGIILFAMTCGYLPFEDKLNENLFKKIVECKVAYPNYIPFIHKDLIKKILLLNPNERIKLNDIKKHPVYVNGKNNFIRHHKNISNYVLSSFVESKENISNSKRNLNKVNKEDSDTGTVNKRTVIIKKSLSPVKINIIDKDKNIIKKKVRNVSDTNAKKHINNIHDLGDKLLKKDFHKEFKKAPVDRYSLIYNEKSRDQIRSKSNSDKREKEKEIVLKFKKNFFEKNVSPLKIDNTNRTRTSTITPSNNEKKNFHLNKKDNKIVHKKTISLGYLENTLLRYKNNMIIKHNIQTQLDGIKKKDVKMNKKSPIYKKENFNIKPPLTYSDPKITSNPNLQNRKKISTTPKQKYGPTLKKGSFSKLNLDLNHNHKNKKNNSKLKTIDASNAANDTENMKQSVICKIDLSNSPIEKFGIKENNMYKNPSEGFICMG